MPSDPLPPDPDSLAKWEKLPQNKPSKDSLPPATGGLRFAFGFVIILLILIVVVLLLQGNIR
jgi:hypothetical protein